MEKAKKGKFANNPRNNSASANPYMSETPPIIDNEGGPQTENEQMIVVAAGEDSEQEETKALLD